MPRQQSTQRNRLNNQQNSDETRLYLMLCWKIDSKQPSSAAVNRCVMYWLGYLRHEWLQEIGIGWLARTMGWISCLHSNFQKQQVWQKWKCRQSPIQEDEASNHPHPMLPIALIWKSSTFYRILSRKCNPERLCASGSVPGGWLEAVMDVGMA